MNTQKRPRHASDSVGHIEEGTAFMALAQDKTAMSGRRGSSVPPSPSRLSEYAFAFQRTAAVRAAVGVDLFTAIDEGHNTLAALAQRCGGAERGIRILCDYLVALGLLTCEGESYLAAPDAAAYLSRRSPIFIGDALGFVASPTALKAVLDDPAAVVRRGGTVLGEAEHHAAPDHVDWTSYARTVAPLMARSAIFLAELVANRGSGTVKRILDIAAGPGQNGIALAKRLPQAEVTAIDWPHVLDVAQENARADGLGERWQALPGSALDVLVGGPYDLALIVRILPLLAPQDREALLRRAHAALTPGEMIVVLQIVLNDDHASLPFAAMMNFNILATTPSGQVPTAGELNALLRTAGFDHVQWDDLPDSDERIAICRK
jgi:2-polyprenyl-3-methyl-5-hydroxy-6-metoxy-1,4-benzoquinol methylase